MTYLGGRQFVPQMQAIGGHERPQEILKVLWGYCYPDQGTRRM